MPPLDLKWDKTTDVRDLLEAVFDEIEEKFTRKIAELERKMDLLAKTGLDIRAEDLFAITEEE